MFLEHFDYLCRKELKNGRRITLRRTQNNNNMDAKYIKKEIADLNGTGRTQAYYKMVTRAMNHEQFIDVLCRDGSLPRSTYKAVLTQIAEKLPGCLANGFSVKIDEVGLFTARLGVRKDMLPDAFEPGETKRNASSIEVRGVSFKADPELIRKTRTKCVLSSGGVSRLKKPKTTLEERTAMARKFLEKYHLMRVMDYVRLTGLSKTTASLELRKIADDPASGITFRGRGSQKFYVLSSLEAIPNIK
jgi:predicted histone-like DNA-binding protein